MRVLNYVKRLWNNYQQKKQEKKCLENEDFTNSVLEHRAKMEEAESQRVVRIMKRVKEIRDEQY